MAFLVVVLLAIPVINWLAIGFASYGVKHPCSDPDLVDGLDDGEECRKVVLVEVSG